MHAQAEATPAVSTIATAEDHGDPRVVLTLLSARASVSAGERFDIGVLFALDAGWHVYFRNPGEAAVGTELTLTSPDATFGPVVWPVPKRIVDPSSTITTFGYEDEVLFVAPATISARATGAVAIRAVVDFVVCRIECIPGRVTLTRSLPVEALGRASEPAVAARFEAARRAAPRSPADAGMRATFSMDATSVRPGETTRAHFAIACVSANCPIFAIDGTRADDVFFADRTQSVRIRPVAVRLERQSVVVTLELRATPDDPGADQTVSGLVALPTTQGLLTLEVSGVLPRARAAPGRFADARAPQRRAESLWLIVLLAFLGGLVLNVMPCVLPMLALKVVGLAKLATGDRGARATSVLAYALGIVVTLLALAFVVVALRSAGIAVGWGFHMQEPRFVAVLAALVVVLSLGLFGVFSIGIDATTLTTEVMRTRGSTRAFGEGVLAVVLATPCSAPFLGTAVGFALAHESHVIVLVFVCIGLGLAAPFALLALVPATRRSMPKPGAWLAHVERVLAFLMLASATWLVWIIGQLSGVDAMASTLVLALLVAFATWISACVRESTIAKRRFVRVVATLAVAIAGFFLLRDMRPARAEVRAGAWSEEAVRDHLSQGRIVFVDFTAAWCITCKTNERFVLDSHVVRARFREAGVVTLMADYTQRDEGIATELARYGKAGVPLYLVYAPSTPSVPEVLPEVLDRTRVLEAITRAQGGSR